MKKIIYLILILFFFKGTLQAQSVPDFTQTDCNGVTHHLYDDLAAGKAVILNFCAGWCGPCRYYDPLLEEINKDFGYGKCNLNIYAFIFEGNTPGVPNTSCAFSESYAQRAGMTFPVFSDIGTWNAGLTGTYFSQYNVGAIPAFFIIIPNKDDPAASEVKVVVGGSENFVQALEDSLALGGFKPNKINFAGELCSDQPYSAQLSSNFTTGNFWTTDQPLQPIPDPTAQTITIGNTGTYTLSHEGCDEIISTSKYVEFNPLPLLGIASSSFSTICPGGFFTLNYTIPEGGSTNVMWQYQDRNGNWLDLAPAGDGPVLFSLSDYAYFRVMATNGSGNGSPNCTAFSNTVTVTINFDQQPAAASGIISSSEFNPCTREPYTLYYSGTEAGAIWQYYRNGDWQIYDYVSNDAITINNDNTTGDSWRVIVPNGDCFAVSNQLDLNFHPLYIGVPDEDCSHTLTAYNNATQASYLWSPGGQTTKTISDLQPGVVYTVQVTNEVGCIASASKKANIRAIFGVVAEPAAAICPGAPVNIHFTGLMNVPACTNAVNGQFPQGAFTFSDLNQTVIVTESALAGQYSVVNVTAGTFYSFATEDNLESFDLSSDNITITDGSGSVVYATGEGAAEWFANFTGQVRFYANEANCAAPGNATRVKFALGLTPDFWAQYPDLFTWLPGGEHSPDITVNPQTTTTYTLLYNDFFGCQTSVDIEVKVGAGQTYYRDADTDGYGDITKPLTACTKPDGYVLDKTDCNDADAGVHVPTQYYVDSDKDGYGSSTTAMLCSSTAPLGYSTNNTDCNDNDGGIHAPVQYYVDADKDGYGSTTIGMLCSSAAPIGYATNNTDCNDNDPGVHVPIQYYVDADKDGYGSATTAMVCSSTAPIGYSINNTDCNDNDAGVHAPIRYYVDGDKDGFGSNTSALFCSSTPPVGYSANNSDCNDKNAGIGGPQTYYRDADGDGYGDGNLLNSIQSCSQPKGYVTNNTDCDDTKATVRPGATEICGNGIDDNCNGQVDENCLICGNASALSTTNITSTSATLNWVAAVSPVQWQLQYKTSANNAKWIDVTLLAGSVRSITLTNLVSKQGYGWHIRAKCGTTWTSYSNTVNFTVLASASLSKSSTSTVNADQDNGKTAISLHPNPTPGRFILELHIPERNITKAQIELVDMAGRKVYAENTNISNGLLRKEIMLPSQAAHGMYIVHVLTNNKMYQASLLYMK